MEKSLLVPRINRKLLFDKLKMYGFTELFISWFKFFISGRAQTVKYFNYLFEQFLVTFAILKEIILPNIILSFYK